MKKRFWFKLVFFVLPPALLLAAGFGLAVYSGEAMPLPMVISIQAASPSTIYRPTYFSDLFAYKVLTTIARQPEVLVLGSSRSFSLRAPMFNRNPSVFYNASAPTYATWEFQVFLRALRNRVSPRVLLLDLDLPWLNPSFPFMRSNGNFNTASVDLEYTLQNGQVVLRDLLLGQADVSRLLDRRNQTALGLGAIANGRGFRGDGSLQFNRAVFNSNVIQRELVRDFDDLRNGQGVFVSGDEVSEERLRQVGLLLDYCQNRGIMVIGFSPPYHPALYQDMMAGGQHGYLPQARARLASLFDTYDFAYFDFTDPASLAGIDENDFYDGWHGGGYVTLRMYTEMVRQLPDILGQYSDLTFLEQTGERAADHLDVFADSER